MSQESMSGDDKENNNIKVEKTVDDNKGQKKQEQQGYNMYTAKIKDYPEQIKPSDFFPENSDYKELKEQEIKTGEDKYYKDYIYLNDWTCYVVEQLEPSYVDKYHYELVIYPERAVPEIEFK